MVPPAAEPTPDGSVAGEARPRCGLDHQRDPVVGRECLEKGSDDAGRRLRRSQRSSLVEDDQVDGELQRDSSIAGDRITDTDTNPHRVFNPTVQGQRFDPDGDYVRRYVPELPGDQGRRRSHDPGPQGAPRLRLPRPRSSTTDEAIAEYKDRHARQ